MQFLSALMSPVFRSVVLGIFMLGAAFAQVSPAPSPPPSPSQPGSAGTFKASSDLVLVPVVVLQGKQHVAGLTKDDFVVLEDRVPQRIAFVSPTTAGTDFKRLGGGSVFTNQVQTSQEPPQLTVIAVDSLNTPAAEQSWVVQQVRKFLSDSPTRREPTAIVAITPKGLRVVHDFTTDSGSLLSSFEVAAGKKLHPAASAHAGADASQHATGQPTERVFGVLSWSETDSLQASDVTVCREKIIRLLEAMAAISESLGGIPGRKTLLWITGAFPFQFDRPDSFLLPNTRAGQSAASTNNARNSQTGSPNQKLPNPAPNTFQVNGPQYCDFRNDELLVLRGLYQRTVRQLADDSVAVYPVDARGVVVSFPDAGQQVDTASAQKGNLYPNGDPSEQEYWIRTSMQTFAEMTGARPCFHNNDFSSCLHDAVADSETYYLLGFYRDKKNDKPGWRNLKVEVKRSGVQVMARNGYFYLKEAPDTSEARQRDVSLALTSPFDFPGVVFSVSLRQSPDADPKLHKLKYDLSIPSTSLMDDPSGKHRMSFELVATAAHPDGKLADQSSKTMGGTLKAETAARILKNGVSYSNSLSIPPGDFTLRFVVRDNVNGRIGSVIVPYTVQ